MADENSSNDNEVSSYAPFGPKIDAIKVKFSSQRIPIEQDFADLIDIADAGRRAVGCSPDQDSAGPGDGLQLSEQGKLMVQANTAEGLKVSSSGVGVNLGQGLMVTGEQQLDVKLCDNKGLEKEGEGLSVKADTNKGIQIDENGVGIGIAPGLKFESNGTLNTNLPIGTIMMYQGDLDQLTGTGWYLCDGQQITVQENTYTTPDLIGRFILGADNNTLNQSSEPSSDGYVKVDIEESGNPNTVVTGTVKGTELRTEHLPEHQHLGGTTWECVVDTEEGAWAQYGVARSAQQDQVAALGLSYNPSISAVLTVNVPKPNSNDAIQIFTSKAGGIENPQAHAHELAEDCQVDTRHTHNVMAQNPYYALYFIQYLGI